MDLRPDEIRELCRQFSSLHDGQLSADEIFVLEAKLRENLAARRLYVRYSRICGGLSWDMGHSTAPLPTTDLDAVGTMESKDRGNAVAFVTDLAQSMFGIFNRPSLYSFGFAAILGAAMGIGCLLAILSIRQTEPPQMTTLAVNQGVPEVRSLKLASGTATLSLAGIGHVVVEGPAEFNLLEPKRAKLVHGRIKMRVTEEGGRGFIVETPGGEVVDLGTEFGLDVDLAGQTSLAVFEGKVDLRMPADGSKEDRVETFELGEGAVVGSQGNWERLMSIVLGDDGTFQRDSDDSRTGSTGIISKVTDNLKADTKKFYQIVPGGLKEDALCYVDRPFTQWNGVSGEGMPGYLIGADYVKTFNDDKQRSGVKIKVKISRPARLFVFFDNRLETPGWLKKQFTNTGDKIGSDFGPWAKNTRGYAKAEGAGNSIDAVFSIWERRVAKPGTVTLEHNPGLNVHSSSMYGIAAVPLDADPPGESSATGQDGPK